MKTPEERLAEALIGIDEKYERRRSMFRFLSIALFAIGVIVFLAPIFIGCPKPGPAPVTPPDASDAAPTPSPPMHADCSAGISRLNQLGCKGGRAFVDICPRVKSQAFKDCVASARDCAAVDDCDK
jgi:hypothetical protein